MKKVSWQQIKSESFNLVSVVEESIEINPKDIPSSFSNLTNIIVELRSLKEALLFKKAKQLKKVSITDSDKQIELFDKLNEKIRKVKIEPLGDAKNVLEKNKEILELKTIQKIFRYAIEIENDPEKVLSLLLESEMREDWEFLCNLIYVYLKFGKNDNKTIFLNYSKKVEDKLVNLFKESYENEKYSQCKSAFKALEVLEKEKVLFETFLYFYSPFNKPVDVIGYHTNKIYLDKTINPENNSFHSFFKEVSEVTNKIGSLGTFIFGTSGDFLNFAVGKMYNVYIARALELYLDIENPNLFLIALGDAFTTLFAFDEEIITRHSKLEIKPYENDLLSQFILTALQKEKDGFDELFDLLIYSKSNGFMYYLFDQQLISTDNIINSFEILMVLVNKSQRRAALFYNEDDEIMLLTYFFQKMKRVIDLTMINSEDKIHSIQDLSHIYLLTKKFLGKKLFIVNEFLENLSNVSKLVFNDVLESINRSIRQQSINIYFTKPDSHKTLLNYVKSKIKIGEVFQGQNYNIFADKILYFLHDALKTQIFTIVFEKDQSDNLIRCIDEIVGYVIFMNRTNMSYYFNYLKNIILLISWPYDKFLDKYKELENVIYDRDLRSLIKCRKDKEKIKNLIVKNIK